MHFQCWSLAASIGGAATGPEVQVNQSCGLNTESHEHVVLKACLPLWDASFSFCHSDMLEFTGIICSRAQVTKLKKQ